MEVERAVASQAPECVANILDTKDVHSRIAALNRILNTSRDIKARRTAVILLDTVIKSCPDTFIIQFGTSWLDHLHSMIKIKNELELVPLLLSTIPELLRRMSKQTELRRTVTEKDVSKHICTVLDLVKSSQDTDLVCAGMGVLSEWCTAFPGSSKQNIAKMKTTCLMFMSTGNTLVQDAAANVFASTALATSRKMVAARWNSTFISIILVTHKVLDELLDNVDEESNLRIDSTEGKENVYIFELMSILKHVEEIDPKRTITLTAICTAFLKTALSLLTQAPSETVVNSPFPAVVQTLFRIFSIDDLCILTCPSAVTRSTLKLCMSKVQAQAWNLMDYVVQAHRSLLLPVSNSIFNVACKLLAHSISSEDNGRENACKQPGSAHELVLIPSLETMRKLFLFCMPPIHEYPEEYSQYIHNLLATAEPRSDQKVEIDVNLTKHEAREHRDQVGIYSNSRPHTGVALAIAALETLDCLLLRSHVHIPSETRLYVDQWLARVSQENLISRPPYNDARCRTRLYTLLTTSILCQTPRTPVLANEFVQILANGLHDPNTEVVHACMKGLASTDAAIRPRHPAVRKKITVARGLQLALDSGKQESATNIASDYKESEPSTTVNNSLEMTPGVDRNPPAMKLINSSTQTDKYEVTVKLSEPSYHELSGECSDLAPARRVEEDDLNHLPSKCARSIQRGQDTKSPSDINEKAVVSFSDKPSNVKTTSSSEEPPILDGSSCRVQAAINPRSFEYNNADMGSSTVDNKGKSEAHFHDSQSPRITSSDVNVQENFSINKNVMATDQKNEIDSNPEGSQSSGKTDVFNLDGIEKRDHYSDDSDGDGDDDVSNLLVDADPDSDDA